MANLEDGTRHNPVRTFVPKKFTDLGNLFNEDSRCEDSSPHQPIKVSELIIQQSARLEEDEQNWDDFIIDEDGVTEIPKPSITQ